MSRLIVGLLAVSTVLCGSGAVVAQGRNSPYNQRVETGDPFLDNLLRGQQRDSRDLVRDVLEQLRTGSRENLERVGEWLGMDTEDLQDAVDRGYQDVIGTTTGQQRPAPSGVDSAARRPSPTAPSRSAPSAVQRRESAPLDPRPVAAPRPAPPSPPPYDPADFSNAYNPPASVGPASRVAPAPPQPAAPAVAPRPPAALDPQGLQEFRNRIQEIMQPVYQQGAPPLGQNGGAASDSPAAAARITYDDAAPRRTPQISTAAPVRQPGTRRPTASLKLDL